MKKRALSITIALLLLASLLSGCGADPAESKESADSANFTVVASFYPVWLIAGEVMRDVPGAELELMASRSTGCLHDYQLTMNDMKLLDRADLFLICGGGLEPFADDLAETFPELPVCTATEGLEMLENAEEHHAGEEDAHDHGEYNAHLWMSVAGACGMADNIAAMLAATDPENAEAYLAGAERFRQEAEALHDELTETLSGVENRNVETFGEAFAYFAADYGFNVVCTIAVDEGEEPAVQTLNEAIALVKQENVQLLWADSQYSASAAETVAGDTGATVVTLSALTGNEEGSWAELMRQNAEALLAACAE